jgi:hypothetical protein
MGSLLQQLENNEVILLLYLADELPAEDRAEVEQMLAVDGNLRLELERIRAAQGSVMADLRRLDAIIPPPVSEAVASRQVSRAMKQWQVDRLTHQPAPVERSGLRYPWWTYPAASAAAIVLAIIVGWGMKPDSGITNFSSNGPVNFQVEPEALNQLEESYKASEQVNGQLPDAEQQASALDRPLNDASSIFMVDPEN